VAISKHLRDELTQRADLDAEKNIWVIPYGVNEELCFLAYQPEADWVEQWERTHGKENGTLSVCLAGAITPLHGLEDLPAILTRTNEIKVPVHVYIAGDVARANRRYIDKLKQLFRRRGIDKQVTWLGHRPDLRNILSICDVALSLAKVPACHDRTLLEALSLGKPLAGYDHGYTGEVLDAFLPEGRVNPGDINGIVDRLEQWHAYRPHMQGELPRPFRLGDTIRSISELCSSLRQENPS
jgi:glycosyltransferase involved in cell wall biosynthesis